MHSRQFEKCVKSVLGAKRKRLGTSFGLLKREVNDGQKLQQLQLPQKLKQQRQTVACPVPPKILNEVVVHWTRSERHKYTSIKLMPPW
ncbi:uncharacterized protein Dvir_GJ26153 [Drosophila virilis]|uniref:Uncharacterized protein n=1 Tax=Drosophila virilis TaxID=7244 RepID=A0A0Q9WGH6_DROVI|nr:uncharacterized protein Dvir_GJ26153 [Drosophila virilis]